MTAPDPDWSQQDDGALVRAVQDGEPRAFEPLVDRHLKHVHAFVALRLPVAHLVDEITHETFVSAFRMMGRFAAGTNLHGWLRVIAANLVRKELDRYRRDQTNKLSFLQRREIDLELAEESELASGEAEALRECLEKVPPTLRTLLDLKYRDGCRSEEIGTHLQRSMAWVRTTLFRVREQLRGCIEAKLEGGSRAGV